jgi:hypothetical protein
MAARKGAPDPVGSYVVLTEPVPELLADIGWTGGEAIADGRMFLHYFRTTADGRVLMGSASGPIGRSGRIDARFFTDEATRATSGAGACAGSCPGSLPRGSSGRGAGPIDVSSDQLPFLRHRAGTRDPTTAPATRARRRPELARQGKFLASLVLGSDDEWGAAPARRPRSRRACPPEPVRLLGGALVRRRVLSSRRPTRRPPGLFARRPRRRCAPACAGLADRDALMPADAWPSRSARRCCTAL